MFLSVMCLLAAMSSPPSDGLRVMVWNVLRGANNVEQGPEKTLQIIREAQPDIVLLQESYDIDGDRPRLGEWLAGELGWHQHQAESKHLCVLTHLTIDETFFHHEWHGVGAKLTDKDGRSLLAWSIWIDWRAFITYALRDQPDISDEALLACESEGSGRLQQATNILSHLQEAGQLQADIPLLVGGDWNCPSHLDWTTDTARIFRHRRALPLPVSRGMQEANFADAYRVIHPHPVQQPGITWSPMDRSKGDDGTVAEQCFERIDRLYLKEPVNAQDGWSLVPVAAEVLPLIWEDASIPNAKREFPSDHGAVVIDLKWVKAQPAKPAS
ncbi:MAG: endonuclease/exonuclease/phosphatase family protein [Phycisphaerales bacterium]|nr:endonuclease/exonuclease/phosphatase family protein [Phycisphaerales bacterium]